MARAKINPRTGRRRRQTVRYTNLMERSAALNSKDELNLHKVRKAYEKCRHSKRRALLLAAVSSVCLDDNALNGDDTVTVILAGALMLVYMHERKLRALRQMDSWIADMTAAEENEPKPYRAKQFTQIDHFINDSEARKETNFEKWQLRIILDKFDVPVNGDSVVVVPYGTNTRVYHFSPEEMLIYYLMRAKGGHPHTAMMTLSGSTDQNRRWSPGCRFLVMHLDHRYRNLIGINGLRRLYFNSRSLPRQSARKQIRTTTTTDQALTNGITLPGQRLWKMTLPLLCTMMPSFSPLASRSLARRVITSVLCATRVLGSRSK